MTGKPFSAPLYLAGPSSAEIPFRLLKQSSVSPKLCFILQYGRQGCPVGPNLGLGDPWAVFASMLFVQFFGLTPSPGLSLGKRMLPQATAPQQASWSTEPTGLGTRDTRCAQLYLQWFHTGSFYLRWRHLKQLFFTPNPARREKGNLVVLSSL